MKRWMMKPWVMWVVAGLLAAAFMAACARITTITFLTNDDNAIAFTLAGYQTGTPYPFALFINCILGHGISGLYGLFPAVPWWAVCQLLVIFVSLTVLFRILFGLWVSKSRGLLWGAALYGALLLTLFVQPVVQLTYTVTAAVLGGAGAALIAAAGKTEKKTTRVMWDVFGGIMVLTAFLYREESGYAVLCFFLAAVLFRVLSGGQGAWRRMLPLVLSVCALCAGVFFYNNAMHAKVNGPAYTDFFIWRERFTDYPRDTYEENPALYQSQGWSQQVYAMANSWCFMDERIDGESLRAITAMSGQGRQSVRQGLETVRDFFKEQPAALFPVGLAALMGLYLAICRPGIKENRPGFIVGICAICGSLCLSLYMGWTGRLVLRALQTVYIPLIMLLSVLISCTAPVKTPVEQALKKVILLLCLGMGVLSGGLEAKSLRANDPGAMLEDSRAVNAYALAHPDRAYLRDTFSAPDIDAFTVYPDKKPVNLISWGGCGMGSDAYYKQLSVNGLLERENTELLLEDGVYFLTKTDSGYETVLLDVIEELYGTVTCTVADTFSGGSGTFTVYKISFDC